MAVQLSMTNEGKKSFTLAPATPSGQPGLIDGSVVATVLTGDATATINPDGLSGFIVSGATGLSTIELSADADLTTGGVKTISEIIEVEVTDPQVATLGLSFGPEEPK